MRYDMFNEFNRATSFSKFSNDYASPSNQANIPRKITLMSTPYHMKSFRN